MPLLCPLLGQDKVTYYTVMNPEQFTIDWTGFYNENDRLTAKARKELPHHLDLAFGDHPKQRLDLYLPKTKKSNAAVFVFLHGGGDFEKEIGLTTGRLLSRLLAMV